MDDTDRKKTKSSRRARAGRPRSEFSSQVADLLVDIVSSGGYLATAIKAVGTSASTVAKWRKQNPEFDARLEAAEAQCESKLITLVHDAAVSDWRAAIALAKSRWPERWSERRMDPAGDNPIASLFEVNLHFITPEVVERERCRLAMQRQHDEATASVKAKTIETTSRPVVVEESPELPPRDEPRN